MDALKHRAAAACLAVTLAACGERGAPPAARPSAATDGPRVVTLAPSLTEIAFAIGAGGALVGDTAYDDYPPAAKRLPHVADLAHADLERLAALRPTVVLALHDQEREGADISSHLHVPVLYLPNRRLPDLNADIAAVGLATHEQRAAARLTARIARELGALAGRHRQRRPRVFFLLGMPGFTVGRDSYIGDVIRIAGGVNAAADIALPYPNVSAESLLQLDPDVLVVARAAGFGPAVRAQEPWRSLRAVRAGRVLVPPDDSLLERNGPRLVQGARWLSDALDKAR